VTGDRYQRRLSGRRELKVGSGAREAGEARGWPRS
jgi:hypothetical protein